MQLDLNTVAVTCQLFLMEFLSSMFNQGVSLNVLECCFTFRPLAPNNGRVVMMLLSSNRESKTEHVMFVFQVHVL